MKIKRISNLEKIYDGFEDGFYELNHSISIPIFDENKTFRVLKLKGFSELDNNLRLQLMREIENIDEKPLSTITTYSYQNLAVEYITYTCDKDQTEIIAILAVGERQPTRYQVILLGLFEIHKNI
jgi:hypothetical protein